MRLTMSNPKLPDLATFLAQFPHQGHGAAIGIRLLRTGPDWSELALDYDPRLIADPKSGVLASGPIITLMDMATSVATWKKRGGLKPQATLDLRIDYIRPATVGETVIGRGECYRMTRRIAFVRGEAHNGDSANPIAHVVGTFMFTDVA